MDVNVIEELSTFCKLIVSRLNHRRYIVLKPEGVHS